MFGRAPGPTGDWEDVPTDGLWKYVGMLPRLEAEQTLAQTSAVAAGTGSMEEKDQRRYMSGLRRVAAGVENRAEKATVASLGMLGIKVETLDPE